MTDPSPVAIGDDGRTRCAWSTSSAEMRRYHDEEWGRPLHGDRALFEKLSLEAFQSGLSWSTVLNKRPAFRAAFHDFEPARVAAFGERDIERLMGDAGIIRNRAKIAATIANARVIVELTANDAGALDRMLWSFAPPRRATAPTNWDEVPAVTAESTAASVALRTAGFRFVGPTTFYALMQSTGMVDDHLAGCFLSAGGERLHQQLNGAIRE